MRIALAAFLWLALAGVSWGQSLELKGDVAVVKVDRIITVKEDRTVVRSFTPALDIFAVKGAAGYWWSVPAGMTAADLGDTLRVTAAAKGEYTVGVKALVIDFDKKTTETKAASVTFIVGDNPLPPVPPPPPIPPPDPKPPAPIPADKLHVMLVCEFTNGSPLLTQAQINELWGQPMADWIRAKDVQMRKFDKDIDAKNLTGTWKAAWSAWKGNVENPSPWLIISNGVTGYSGPLPATGILDFLKKYER